MEDGIAITGETACVRFATSQPTVIAHEVGHIAGMPDCTVDSGTCKMMNTNGGGGMPPTPSECNGLKNYVGDSFVARFGTSPYFPH